MVLASKADNPVAVLLKPVLLLLSARVPLAVLPVPVVLLSSASEPIAVLLIALVLVPSASKPTAVLELPVVSLVSALTPTAVLELPVVTFKSALSPKIVLSLVKQPSRQTARAAGESAMARMPSALRRICCKTRRELNIRTVVLTSMGIEGYIGNFFLLPV